MTNIRAETIDWGRHDGLVPAIIQHARSGRVLMLGYMNAEALARTQAEDRVVFFSRSRQRLWVKGETSGNYLRPVAISADCDRDALLVLAEPGGPVCHKGTESCFADAETAQAERIAFLARLEEVIARRIEERPDGSYTARLHGEGPGRIAQKLGEEGVELALAAVTRDDAAVLAEGADLVYHLLLLLKARGLSLARVVEELESRHADKIRA